MKFSIVTPSFNQLDWLRLCIASVADQGEEEKAETSDRKPDKWRPISSGSETQVSGFRSQVFPTLTIEHIIQDAGTPGIEEFVRDFPLSGVRPHPSFSLRAFVEKDCGMYDAVNRGLRRANGDILAYLNCDEQLLPGALKAVGEYFKTHPKVDILFTDTVIVNGQGGYFAHRLAVRPTRIDRWVRMRTLTCAMFFRRRILDEGLLFDTRWKAAGDYFWVMSAIDRGYTTAVLRRFTSSFTETGENLGTSDTARAESRKRWALVPRWAKVLYPAVLCLYWLRVLLSGAYSNKSFVYSIFTAESPASRRKFEVESPSLFWKGRL